MITSYDRLVSDRDWKRPSGMTVYPGGMANMTIMIVHHCLFLLTPHQAEQWDASIWLLFFCARLKVSPVFAMD